jgi:hypothetical protein
MSNKTFFFALAASLLVGLLLGWCLKGCTNSPEALRPSTTAREIKTEAKPLEKITAKEHIEILKGQSRQGSKALKDSTTGATAKLDFNIAVTDSGAVSLDYELSLLPIYYTVFETITITKPELQYVEVPWYLDNWFYSTLALLAAITLALIY